MDPSVVTCFGGKPSEYRILVGQGVLRQLGIDVVALRPQPSSVVIVTDANVWRWHGWALSRALREAGAPTPLLFVLGPGESSKTRGVKEAVEDYMLANRCLRDTLVIAFGGGVVGDLAGFVAATYMRGVRVMQVPTTLLAAADSSIGGKTAVDTPGGKNLIGAFHQPVGVYVDLSTLISLPVREVSNGMAEVIKAGAIADAALFELCERHADALLGREAAATATVDITTGCYTSWTVGPPPPPLPPAAAAAATDGPPATTSATVTVRELDLALLGRALEAAIAVKARVVTADEREGGLRGTLNFGHTVGHGLEAVLQPAMLHGECVAIGMVKEAEAARALGHCTSSLVGRIKRCCKALGLPVAVPPETASGPGLAAAVDFMLGDKKNARESSGAVAVKCVLLRGIGEVVSPPFTHAVPLPLLHRLLSRAVALSPAGPGPSAPLLRVRVPGSKSVSNRALLLAGVARGRTTLRGLLASDDTEVMMAALGAIGAKLSWDEADPTAVVVEGNGGAFQRPPPPGSIYVGNAGTASRFLAAMFCLLPLGAGAPPVVLCGNARMHARPIGPLVDALREQGAMIEYGGTTGCPPLRFTGGIDAARDSRETLLRRTSEQPDPPPHRVIFLEGKVSSQYVSAVLMAAPYFPPFRTTPAPGATAPARDVVELRLAEEHPTSLPYISMTLTVMASFGVKVTRLADNRYIIPLGPYSSPASGVYDIEADASSASYPAAAAALTGRTVLLEGVGSSSTQGDAAFPLLLKRMGCEVQQDEHCTTVSGPAPGAGLAGIDVNMAGETDTFMTLAVVAAAASGVTRITGIANQRVKECDRIAAMIREFAKCGVRARELPDGIEITGCGLRGSGGAASVGHAAAHGGAVHCYDDHRIAMSFAVLGLCPGLGGVSGAAKGVSMILDDQACVEKTYPEFWDDIGAFFDCTVCAAPARDAREPSSGVASENTPARDRVVVIGMRGAGKSSLCRAAGAALGVTVFDLDEVILEAAAAGDLEAFPTGSAAILSAPVTVAGLVAAFGWEAFRQAESELLARYLRPSLQPGTMQANRCIISCGGGIVESESARSALRDHISAGGVVIEVRRDITDVIADLSAAAAGNASRPAYAAGASLEETYARRRSWYDSCSSRVFSVPSGERDWGYLSSAFSLLVRKSLGDTSLSWRPEQLTGALGDTGRSWPPTACASHSVLGCSDGTAFVCLALRSISELGAADGSSPPSEYGAVMGMSADAALAAVQRLRSITAGCDAVELRVDCLDAVAISDDAVLAELATLKKLLQSPATETSGGIVVSPPPSVALPVIFTVRTAAEGGKFKGSASDYYRLLVLGAKGGAEIIDVEVGRSALPQASLLKLVADIEACGSAVLPSAHWTTAPPPPPNVISAVVAASLRLAPHAFVVKVVASVEHPADGVEFQASAREARAALAANGAAPAILAVAMGAAGQMTRVCNDVLTPVTHPLLPAAAAPGQLSLASVRSLRSSLGLVRPRAYFLFGRPVSASVSPVLHNAGFAALGLPHVYGLVDTDDAVHAVAVLRGAAQATLVPSAFDRESPRVVMPRFVGGANITIPLKTVVLPLLDRVSPAAKAIGAVNVVTCVPLPGGGVRLCGDNTDWLGIFWPVSQRLTRIGSSAGAGLVRVAIVLGAGGTAMAAAYAARWLGLVPLFHNRTHSKAEALAARFCGFAAASLGSESDAAAALSSILPRIDDAASAGGALSRTWVVAAVLSTLPPAADIALPPWVLLHRPVVLDVAYTSATTPLLAAAAAAGCPTVPGAEMLCTQGLFAFSVWVGRAVSCAAGGEGDGDDEGLSESAGPGSGWGPGSGSCSGPGSESLTGRLPCNFKLKSVVPAALPASIPTRDMIRAALTSLAARSSGGR